MSGLEAIAVIGVVASLIAAFKDSSSIANAIKQRRKSKPDALPPTFQLEEALAAGEQEIQRVAADGIRKYGHEWVEDDLEAKVALQAIVIEVQASMLKDLRIAVQDDSVTDFADVIEVSTEARMKAVNILTGLYLRKNKQASSPAVEVPHQVSGASARATEQAQSPPQQRSQPIPVPDRSRDVIEPPRQQEIANERWKSSNETRPTDVGRPERKQSQSRSSWKRKLSGWTQSYVDEQLKGPLPTSIEQTAPPARPYPASMSSTLGRTPLPYSLSPTQTHSDPLNPWAETRSTTDSESRRSVHSMQSQQLNRQDTRFSIHATTISPENNFGGFCQGAYQLQVGLIDSAIKRKNESVSMTGQGQYYACRGKRCVFEGPAVMYEQGWSYDRNLRSRTGLKYRWLFLAKSHIPQERVKNKLYDFRCLICVLLGDKSSIFHGTNHLLEHVGGHAGSQVAGIILRGPLVLGNSSIAPAHDDNFDINFLSERASSFLEHSSSSPTSTHMSSDVISVEGYDTMSTFNPKWR